MNAELTAEKRPACGSPIQYSTPADGYITAHEEKGGIQAFIVFPCVVTIKFLRFLTINGEEVGTGVVGP